jgi:hypothetical protein
MARVKFMPYKIMPGASFLHWKETLYPVLSPTPCMLVTGVTTPFSFTFYIILSSEV